MGLHIMKCEERLADRPDISREPDEIVSPSLLACLQVAAVRNERTIASDD